MDCGRSNYFFLTTGFGYKWELEACYCSPFSLSFSFSFSLCRFGLDSIVSRPIKNYVKIDYYHPQNGTKRDVYAGLDDFD